MLLLPQQLLLLQLFVCSSNLVLVVSGFESSSIVGKDTNNNNNNIINTLSNNYHQQQQQLSSIPFINNIEFQEYCNGQRPLVCIRNVLSDDIIQRLKYDAKSLQNSGFGKIAGVVNGSNNVDIIRKDVHQIWLNNNENSSSMFIGDIDVRKYLYNFIDTIRYYIELSSIRNNNIQLPSNMVELSYLLYNTGSYYRCHIDTINNNNKDIVRTISMILYLGSNDENEREWDCTIDGGALRIYGEKYAKYTGNNVVVTTSIEDNNDDHDNNDNNNGDSNIIHYSDISPIPGTLLLFDSDKVPHEVLTTYRSRICCVGWFNSPTNTT